MNFCEIICQGCFHSVYNHGNIGHIFLRGRVSISVLPTVGHFYVCVCGVVSILCVGRARGEVFFLVSAHRLFFGSLPFQSMLSDFATALELVQSALNLSHLSFKRFLYPVHTLAHCRFTVSLDTSQQRSSFNQIYDAFSRDHAPITHAWRARRPAHVESIFNECVIFIVIFCLGSNNDEGASEV